MSIIVHKRSIKGCVLCRANIEYHELLGISWENHKKNLFTDWFNSNQAKHKHVWYTQSCERSRNLFGINVFWLCGQRHPAFDISAQELYEYVSINNKADLSKYYKDIVSIDRGVQKAAVTKMLDTYFEYLETDLQN